MSGFNIASKDIDRIIQKNYEDTDVELECEFVYAHKKAVKVLIDDEEYWVPFSQISGADVDACEITVSKWWVSENDLE